MPFLDEGEYLLRSGRGGDGCVSFRRERFLPRGGPDGGDGGRGGHVYLVARSRLNTLDDLRGRRTFEAGRGQPGRSQTCHGRTGKDLEVELPVGTIVRDAERGHVLLELMDPDQPVLLLQGGRGGRGNHSFRGPTRRAPRHAQKGGDGLERRVRLELKLLADVGLVGLPNAGKSTLLTHLSRARPRIGEFPFTTLQPRIGVVELDYETLTVADLPGLLEGAHQGRGLGDRFLRHVERTRVMLHVVDASRGGGPELAEAWRAVRTELEEYGHGIGDRPELVVLSKADLRPDEVPVEDFERLTGASALAAAPPEGRGLGEIIRQMFRLAAT